MIDIEPDPLLPAAQRLAAKIASGQSKVRISNGIGYSVMRTTEEEAAWLGQYRRAEIAIDREHRAAEREARRAARRSR